MNWNSGLNRTLALALLLSVSLAGSHINAYGQETQRHSRLSDLIRTKTQLFLPTRLVLGEDNFLTIQAPPGSHVRLLFSPEDRGFTAPNGQELRVGDHNEEITGEVPEKGVLKMTLNLPKEDILEGKQVYLEALVWRAEDYSDMEVASLMDATGHVTEENHLVLMKPTKGKGAVLLPNMPGMSPQMFQQLTQFSQMNPADPHHKELFESGDINKTIQMDQNSLITRPGSVQPGLR